MGSINLGDCDICRDHVTTAQAFIRVKGKPRHWTCNERILSLKERDDRRKEEQQPARA